MKVDVVLPAAGTSERMNLLVPKQFLKVMGKHVLAYTVDCFHRLSWVRHIVIVVSADQIDITRELIKTYGFTRAMVCVGSSTRHRSIFCGLQLLQTERSGSDVVIIHDAARPFVPEDVARQVAEAAESHGAAGVTRPLVSTVIQGDHSNILVESLDRRLYRNSEMPQAFQYGVITSAYEKCSQDDLDHGTECLLLALKYSQCAAKLVPGTDDLWKVTYQKDVYSMENVVREKFTIVSIINKCSSEFLALGELHNILQQRNIQVVENASSPANTFVVVLDSHSSQTLDQVTNQIRDVYRLDKLSSCVRPDAMVIIVFIHNSNIIRSDKTNESSQPSDDKRLLENVFYGNILSTNGTCTTLQCHTSDLDGSWISGSSHLELHTLHQTEPGHLQARSKCSTCNLQTSDYRVDSTSHQEELDSLVTFSETLELPTDVLSNLHDLNRKLQASGRRAATYKIVVRAVKDKLKKDVDGQAALVVGVTCQINSPVSEQLAELIWQRSLCVDGQVLTYDET